MKKIIQKSRLGWIITDESITVFDKIQATIYHTYDLTNRQPFYNMVEKILQSNPDELNSWVDVVDLSVKQGVRGYGTRVPRFDES